ncbi:MAG: adenylate/guanylate cyclase domain-containing protein [Pseudomonadota bacterium]
MADLRLRCPGLSRVLLGLLITGLFLLYGAGFLEGSLLHRLERWAYDERLALTAPDNADPRITLIDVDERSLAEQGQWPWPRDTLARLVDILFEDHQIRVLGLDMVFTERGNCPGQPDTEARLAASFNHRAVVLGYYFNTSGTAELSSGTLPAPLWRRNELPPTGIGYVSARSYGGNLAELQQSARRAGHFNPLLDEDGVVRRVPMLIEYQGGFYESLALAVARTYLGVEQITPGLAETGTSAGYAGLEWLALDSYRVPVDAHLASLVPYRSLQGHFRHLSATDVLKKRPLDLPRDGIVLLGTSAPGLLDSRTTPLRAEFPGVEIHANLIDGILNQTLQDQPAYLRGIETFQLALIGLVASLWLSRRDGLRLGAAAAGLLLVNLAINLAIWQYGGLALPVASSVVLILVVWTLNLSYGALIKTGSDRRLLSCERRVVTVLFAEIADFYPLAEGLVPIQQALLLHDFLTVMTRIVERHGGIFDHHQGSALQAFWSASPDVSQPAQSALSAARDMVRMVASQRQSHLERGWPALSLEVAVHTGTMMVGNLGHDSSLAYRVVGETVGWGSHLARLAPVYGVSIVVSDTTRRAVDNWLFRELDLENTLTIWEPIGPLAQVGNSRDAELTAYHQAIRALRAGDWDLAEIQLTRLQTQAPQDRLYHLHLNRVAALRQNPPT